MANQLFRGLRDRQQSHKAFSPEPGAIIVHKGWLGKKGSISRRWKQLYFVLWNDGKFLGYKNEPSNPPPKPSHKYLIRRRRIKVCSKNSQPGTYKFHIRGARRTFFKRRTFGAESRTSRALWLEALTQVEQEVTQKWKARRNVSRASIEDYNILRLIGRGSYSTVELCRKRTTGKLFAVKTVNKLVLPQDSDSSVFSEWNILADNDHPFLPKLYCWFQSDIEIFLVMEYASGGNFSSLLRRRKKLKESEAWFYAAQIAAGIGCLHSRHVIHRDINPENILIASDGYLKLVDFNHAKKLDGSEGTARGRCGTLNYEAPEMVHSMDYGRGVDWWSLGIIVFEMLTGQTPFKRWSEANTTHSIMFDPVAFPHYVSQEAKSFITELLQKNPSLRLGSSKSDYADVKRHHFFAKINLKALLRKEIRAPFVPALNSDDDTRYFENIERNRPAN